MSSHGDASYSLPQVKNIYNETITLFFIHIVDKAIQKVKNCLLRNSSQ